MEWNFELLAAQFLRALRGARSQTAFARRLKYRSNIIYSWEAARAFPTAAKALWAAERSGIDVGRAVSGFLRFEPVWLAQHPLTTSLGVCRLLEELKGRASVVSLAEATDRSRFSIARWLKGTAEPRLPDFLRVVEACTLRGLDFVAAFLDPGQLSCVAARWQYLEAARRAAYEQPWTQAVMRCLELCEYTQQTEHQSGWIAAQLGISEQAERQALDLLVASGQVQYKGGKYVPLDDLGTVDTRRDPELARQLRLFWSKAAAERLERGDDGLFAYNVFSVSEADLERIRELQKAYYQEVRAIVARSNPVERVALLNLQLLQLS